MKCRVENNSFVIPCKTLSESSQYGNPRGKQKGIYAWELSIRGVSSRTFFGVKSGEYIAKGIAFNFCPFCGENININYEVVE